MADPRSDEAQRDWQAIGVASGLGCSIVVSLIMFLGGGILIDRWLDIQPIGVLTGMVLGLIAAGYQIYQLATLGPKRRAKRANPTIKRVPIELPADEGRGRGE
jgi:F0F1-type ATP synthase assembly protein I